MNTHALVTEGSSVLVCGHRRWTGIQLFIWFPFCTSPSIIIYDPHTCGLAIKGKSRACPSQTAQPDVSKGFVGANSSAAWLPRSSVSELAQRVSAQKVWNCWARVCFFFFLKAELGVCVRSLGLSSSVLALHQEIFIFKCKAWFFCRWTAPSTRDVNSLFCGEWKWFTAHRSWTHQSFFY